MVSTPSAPSASETAAAQTGTNVNTAIANAALSRENQITPDGTITYDVTGYTKMTDQEGHTYDLPTYTATTKLSDANQKIYDTNLITKQNLADIGSSQSAKIGDLLNTSVDLSSGNLDNYTNTHWQSGFDRTWNNSLSDLEQKLANQGVKIGSDAYTRAMQDFTTSRQAAEDQYLGDMYSNAQSSILTERNQPINEISALLTGTQVSNPTTANASNTSSSTLPTVDYASLVNQQYQNELAASKSANSGLFGLGSTVLGGLFDRSDRRLKSNVRRIGRLRNGLPVYSYMIEGRRECGLMADEVACVHPDAVRIGADGYARVNYAKAVL